VEGSCGGSFIGTSEPEHPPVNRRMLSRVHDPRHEEKIRVGVGQVSIIEKIDSAVWRKMGFQSAR
jgi:hypothetical protein